MAARGPALLSLGSRLLHPPSAVQQRGASEQQRTALQTCLLWSSLPRCHRGFLCSGSNVGSLTGAEVWNEAGAAVPRLQEGVPGLGELR